ncbi:hypothetical protein QIW57_06095 [Francisellaceae bacterium CB52]
MYVEEQKEAMDYHTILKEIVSLKRYELLEFKKRFKQMFEDIKYKRFSMPYRFASNRLNCGFVFISLLDDKVEYWQNILQNSMEKFKYKHKLNKCIGVIAYKVEGCFDINWGFMQGDCAYNEELEKAFKSDEEFYGEGEIKQLERYNLK